MALLKIFDITLRATCSYGGTRHQHKRGGLEFTIPTPGHGGKTDAVLRYGHRAGHVFIWENLRQCMMQSTI